MSTPSRFVPLTPEELAAIESRLFAGERLTIADAHRLMAHARAALYGRRDTARMLALLRTCADALDAQGRMIAELDATIGRWEARFGRLSED